jgi:trigger factor
VRVKISAEERAPREAVLTIELDPADVEPYLDRAYKQVVRRVTIPGFRKGKAPRRIVEQLYGRAYLLNESMDSLVQELTYRAVDEQSIDIGGIPQINLEEFDPPKFTATVPLVPSVDLGSYETVRVAREEAAIDESQVDSLLERVRAEQAVWEPAKGPVREDDLVNLTVVGWTEQDGERKEFVRSQESDYIPRTGGQYPIPGFDEALVGLEEGVERETTIEVPADFDNAELAGRTAHVAATAHSIKRKELPALDDEFAKGVGDGFDSLEALKERIRSDMRGQAERNASATHEDATLSAMVEVASFEISPILIEHELEHYVHDQEERIQSGRFSLEDYQQFLAWQGMSDEERHEDARPKVEERVKRAHLLRVVAEKQALEATEEDVEAEIDTIATENGAEVDEVRKLFADPERRDSIRRILVNRKAIEFLTGISGQEDGAKPKRAAAKAKSAPKDSGDVEAETAAKPRARKSPAAGGKKAGGSK